ncbi:MAG: hypothetical protein ACP5XB_10550 [Isosphaeraceae bacterium]
MNGDRSYLGADASRKVLWPILGLLAGLLMGGLRSWLAGVDELAALSLVIAGGVVGSALGMVIVLAQLFPPRNHDLGSLKGLMSLVLAATLILWFVVGYLRILIAH